MFDYSKLLGAMAQRGVTRTELANRIGISRTWLSTVLKKGMPMPNDMIFRIAQALETEDYGNLFFTINVKKH